MPLPQGTLIFTRSFPYQNEIEQFHFCCLNAAADFHTVRFANCNSAKHTSLASICAESVNSQGNCVYFHLAISFVCYLFFGIECILN